MNDYIGATGNFYINDYIDYTSNINFIYTSNSSNYLNKRIDDIDIETSNISSNISSIYSNNLRNELWDINPNNDLCLIKYKTYSGIPHNYVINSNVNGEIRFSVLNSYATNNAFPYNCSVKIDNIGKLMIYHNFIPIQPLFPQAWYDVEGELFALKNEVLVVINPAIASLGAFQVSAINQITLLQALTGAQQYEIQSIVAVLNAMAANDEVALINGIQSFDGARTLFGHFVQSMSTSYAATATTWLGSAFFFGVPLMLNSMADYMYREHYNKLVDNFSNAYIPSFTTEQKRILYSCNDEAYQTSFADFYSNSCNLGIYQGFINSNIITNQFISSLNTNEIKINNTNISNIFVASNVLSNINLNQGFINSNIITNQFIPTLKSNKIMVGSITTPNSAYQLECSGDININQLYLNSVSLTSLLNQKQGNLTFTQPLYNTTNTIGLNYDSSLTKIGNNLSVVKTATSPIIITGNDFSLSYDATLTKIGNSLSVASGSASKWITSGSNIYNNNSGFVGIGNTEPIAPLTIGTSKISGVISDGYLIIGKTNGAGGNRQFKIGYDDDFYFNFGDFGGNNNISATWTKQMSINYNAPNYSFRVLTNGNVGIGFSTPQQKLSINGITEIANGNASKLIFSYNTANEYRHHIFTGHDSSSGDTNYMDFNNWRYGQTSTSLGDKTNLRLHNKYTAFYGNKYFWINDKIIDSGNKNYTLTPLSVFNQTASSSSVLNDPQPILNLARQGTASQTYGQNACFKLCRWENSGVNSRTRLDIDLSDGANDDTNIISLRSDGRVSLSSGKLYLATQIIQDYLFNCSGRNHSSFTDFNSPTDFGTHFIVGNTNSPNVNGATEYYSWSMGLGANYTNIKVQFAIGRNVGNPYLCVRYNESGSWSSWYKLSCGLADNATNATFRIRSPSESTSASLDLGTPYNSSAVNKCSIIAQGISSYSRSELHFCLNNTADNTTQATVSDARITIKPTGNIGFGNTIVPTQSTSATSYFLHLGNSQSARTEDWNVCFHKSTGNGGTRMFNIGYTGDGTYDFYECLGDIGYNNTLADWMYHLAIIYNAPDYCCIINNQGNMTLHGQFYPYSDEKIKTDIETIDNALEKVCDLRGVYYTDIIHQERKIGLIAQEVEMVIPEVVITEVLTDTKAVNYNGLVGLLIEGIKELKDIVDNQNTKINNLLNRIELLENK